MSVNASIIPSDDSTDLAFDIVKHFVAQILRDGITPNFTIGTTKAEAQSQTPYLMPLYPRFWEDKPDDCGFVVAYEGEARGSQPIRNARVTVGLRCKSDASGSSPRYTGGQKVQAAANAIEKYLRPNPGLEQTLQTLPSGRRVLIFENVTRSPGGRDASQRDQVVIEFTMQIQEAGTP